ncbi:MAG: O-methyltransferase [Lachnospiraceae bacterium]|nr:O-methyltransferase [Lachnospiraceae bacterium]
MIIPERLSVYINSLDTGNGAFLDELERTAIAAHVPVIRQDMQSLLKVLLTIRQPRRILEVGTAIGFSSLLMAANTPPDCRITTIENYEKRIVPARENIARAGMEKRITLLYGDAQKILPTLDPSYDFIFMDAAKGQYIHFLPEVLRLLSVGGVLVSDNVLQDGDLIESHYAVEQRNRTIYKRMREYLYTLKHTDGLETSVLAVGDGAAVTVKKNEAVGAIADYKSLDAGL